MKRLTDLRFLFTVVAVLETFYALAGILTPPSLIASVPGWNLTPDGHWVTKLMGVALASQAMVAWALRKQPPLSVAAALAFYQVGSATVDWVMWLAMSEQGIFSTVAGRVSVLVSIPTHYTLGLLLALAIRQARRGSSREPTITQSARQMQIAKGAEPLGP